MYNQFLSLSYIIALIFLNEYAQPFSVEKVMSIKKIQCIYGGIDTHITKKKHRYRCSCSAIKKITIKTNLETQQLIMLFEVTFKRQ